VFARGTQLFEILNTRFCCFDGGYNELGFFSTFFLVIVFQFAKSWFNNGELARAEIDSANGSGWGIHEHDFVSIRSNQHFVLRVLENSPLPRDEENSLQRMKGHLGFVYHDKYALFNISKPLRKYSNNQSMDR
jgi:hypothetical protein